VPNALAMSTFADGMNAKHHASQMVPDALHVYCAVGALQRWTLVRDGLQSESENKPH